MNINNTYISPGQMLTVMIICSLLSASAWSAEVTYADDAYTTGDTLTADDLNAKFNDIKAGVNGNHSNINNNSTAITSLIDRINDRTTAATPGVGEMQFWNGTAWVLVPAPGFVGEATLTFINGAPAWKQSYYKVGDIGPAGGVVFYTTDSGTHGMEVSPVDLSTAAPWGCYGDVTGISDTAIGTGVSNTSAFIRIAPFLTSCQGETAAKIADDYTLNGYTDWFLPSTGELDKMHFCDSFCGLNDVIYWSSSEFVDLSSQGRDRYMALTVYVADPAVFVLPVEYEKTALYAVRAVRAF